MLTPLELHSRLPLVIEAPQPRAVLRHGRFGSRAKERERAECWRSAAQDIRPVIQPCWCRSIACARVVVFRIDEAANADVPQRIGRRGMRQMAEGHGWHRRVRPQRRCERSCQRWLLRVDPKLVVKAVIELPARCWLPGELREDLVLLVGSREPCVRARLTVIVPQVLISDEEPGSIANNRTANIRRQVAIPVALVSALRCTRPAERTTNRLAGEARCLKIVRRVIEQ